MREPYCKSTTSPLHAKPWSRTSNVVRTTEYVHGASTTKAALTAALTAAAAAAEGRVYDVCMCGG